MTWKENGSDLPADLRELPGEAGSNCNSSWGHALVAAILGSSFYHKDTGAGRHHFGILLLAN